MERIKHLLLLWVFLLGVTSMTHAQMRMPQPSDLDIDEVELTLDPSLLVSQLLFTGCEQSANIEVLLSITGTTGVYDSTVSDPNWIGLPQLVPLCYRLYWSGEGEDILGLGAYDPLDSSTYYQNQSNFEGDDVQATLDGTHEAGATLQFVSDMVMSVGTGIYTVEAYYCPNRDEYSVTTTVELSSSYGIELEMNDWLLYMGCVNHVGAFEFGSFEPWCEQDAILVIEYNYGENVLNEMEIEIPVLDNTTIEIPPVAESVGCGEYYAYIKIRATGGEYEDEYLQASPKVPFKICAKPPYVLTMEDWDLLYYAWDPLKCENRLYPAFHIFGPAGDVDDPETRPTDWVAEGFVYLHIWHVSGDKVLDIPDDGFPFLDDYKYGGYGYGGKGAPHDLWIRDNFPPIAGPGCGVYQAQLFCADGTPASDLVEEFNINVEYPIVAENEEIAGCMDPVCPEMRPIKIEFDVTNKLCELDNSMTPLTIKLVHKDGVAVFGDEAELSWSNNDSYYWINNKDQNGGVDHITLFAVPKAPGKGTYELQIYYGDDTDPDNMIGSFLDTTGDCPVVREIDIDIECCDLLPGQLIISPAPEIPAVFCTEDNPLELTLTALYDPDGGPGTGSPVGGYRPVCEESVTFGLDADEDNPATLTATIRGVGPSAMSPVYSGGKFIIKFEGYGKGVFYLYPITMADNACGEQRGDSIRFEIDVRKPLSLDMLEHQGEVFYRANGSDPFGPLVLTNDNLPEINENDDASVVMDMWILDPNGLLGYATDHVGNPFHYDTDLGVHYFRGIERDATTGEIIMPLIYLQNGGLTQEPLVVRYGLRYDDGFACCDLEGRNTILPPGGITVCEWTEFYIVVKPLDGAINQDLMAQPVMADPICFDPATANEFNVLLNAYYQEKPIFENGGQLPTGLKVNFRIDWVSGDEIIDLLNDQPTGIITSDPVDPNNLPEGITWNPTAIKAGKGVYMVTPQFDETMTLTNGVAVIFTLEAQEGLSADMVGINGLAYTFAHGDFVPAISLEADLPVGAKVTWEWDVDSDNVGTAEQGTSTIPAFTATNATFEDLIAEYNATISYPNGGCPEVTDIKWTITVKPTIVGDELIAIVGGFEAKAGGAKAGEVIIPPLCKEGTAEFTPDATYQGQTAPSITEFRVEFVSGDDVASFNPAKVTMGNNFTVKAERAGKGVYQLVPSLLGVRGVPATFTIEVSEPLADDMVGLNGQTLTYKNADVVQSIYLDALLPEGATVTWKWDDTLAENDKIGSALAGKTYIPNFIAQNPTGKDITANYSFTISYPDSECAEVTGTFSIVVQPNVIEDINLIANPVTVKPICYSTGAKFGEISFTAKHVFDGDNVAATFRVEFVSGNAIVDLATDQPGTDGKWTPTAIAAGTGIYRVVPTYNNGQGIPATFTLTALEALDVTMIGINGAEFNYQNGETVHAISLDTDLPAGAKVTWTATGDDIGLNSASGNAIVPSFVAINPGLTPLTATINFTITNGQAGCGAEGSFTITVSPNTIEDYDLVMDPIAGEQRICNDPDGAFAPVQFKAERTDGATFNSGDVKYVVSFVGGTDVLDLSAGNIAEAIAGTAASWTPTNAYDRFGDLISGTGTYRVTPYWNNGQGVPVIFNLTVYPKLDNNQIDVLDAWGNPMEFVYKNGDVVPELNFAGTKMPAGVTIAWEWNNISGNNYVGSTYSGVGRMPGFIAVNKTAEPITAEYIAWLKYEECSSKAEAVKFYITVEPKVLVDTDLKVAAKPRNQTICEGANFEDVVLTTTHRFDEITLPFTYEYVLIDGDDVLGSDAGILDADCNPFTWEISGLTGGMIGTGTYSITPIMDNYSGVPVEITLTRLDKPQVNEVPDFVLCNGEGLNVVFTSKHADTEFDWEVDTADKGKLTGLANSGAGFINVAKLTHKEAKPVTVTIGVTPRNPNKAFECAGDTKTFKVTVNPVPVADYLPNYAYVHGTAVGKDKDHVIEFTGVADAYKWSSSNPTIYEGLDPYQYSDKDTTPEGEVGYTSGIVEAASDGKFYMPDFTVANYTKEIVTSTITVTPMFGDCEGEPIQFHILVKSEVAGIILESVKDVVLCEGETTDPISFGLPLETFYYVTWTGGSAIGLADNDGTAARAKNIPSFVAKAGSATVSVTPHIRYNSVEFNGTAMNINFIVHPKFDLTGNISDAVEVINIEFSTCHTSQGNSKEINLSAGVSDAKYAYQWYKNGVAIPGETSPTYKRSAETISMADAGEYYCMVSSKNGCANDNGVTSVRSKIYKVEVSEVSGDVLVEQLWNDVLQVNCIPSENGGRTYIAFAWFKEDGTAIGDGKSWVQVPDTNAKYYVEASTASGVYTSCPISLVATSKVAPVTVYVAPSPVTGGSSANVIVSGITEGSLQIIDSTGGVISTVRMDGAETAMTMPNISGIYIVRAISDTEGKAAETKVIVK